MTRDQREELGRHFDQFMYGDPRLPVVKQSVFSFKAVARDLYSAESTQLKEKYTLEKYISDILIPEVANDLNKRQASHPVVVPERTPPK